jgi:hypothetical protein
LLIENPWRLGLSPLPFPQGFTKAQISEPSACDAEKPRGHFWEEVEMIRKVLYATLATMALSVGAARAEDTIAGGIF